MEQRNAVILTGFMRQYEDTIDEFKSNLLTDKNVDVFIATWDTRGYKVSLNDQVIHHSNGMLYKGDLDRVTPDPLINAEKLYHDYNACALSVQDLDVFTAAVLPYAKLVETSDIMVTEGILKPKTYKTLLRRYSMFYMSYQGWKFMKKYATDNDIEYQKVVKVRADFERKGYYPKVDWSKDIPQKLIKIGDWNLQVYPSLDKRIKFKFQDHFAIGNYKDMEVYFNMFNNLSHLSGKFDYLNKQWHGEYCLSLWLTMNGIHCIPHNDEKKLLEWSQVGTSVPIPKSLEYKKDNELK